MQLHFVVKWGIVSVIAVVVGQPSERGSPGVVLPAMSVEVQSGVPPSFLAALRLRRGRKRRLAQAANAHMYSRKVRPAE
jgi:hypothetical protein